MTPRRWRRVAMAAALGALVLSGCAGERYARKTTEILSEDVVSLRTDLNRFLGGQERIAERRINAVLRDVEHQRTVEEIVKKRLGDQSGASTLHQGAFDQARRTIATERARAAERAAEAETLRQTQEKLQSDLNVKLEELINQLKDLAAAPSLQDRASFLSEYLKRTKKALDEAEKAANKP